MKTSAGLLPYRVGDGVLEMLICHPGGPFFAKRDAGAWSVIKGEIGADEEARSAAAREFAEETGWVAPTENWIDLGTVRLRSGKAVVTWAVEADFDPDLLDPGTFSMTWHGRRQEFPEIDRVAWCSPAEAMRLLNPAQGAFIDRLQDRITISGPRS